MTQHSIGIAGATPADVVRRIAPAVEAAGFRALWVNDTPSGEALAALAEAAAVTSTLRLATGVIAVDRRPPAQILARVRELGLPTDRLELGVGSGGAQRPLALVDAAVAELQDGLAVPVIVGALGPRMRHLAATRASGVLLNWLTPAAAAEATGELRAAAADASRPAPRSVLYTRTIVHAAARPALKAEADRYAGIPSYARNLERIGARAIDTTIRGTEPEALGDGIRSYSGSVDELVMRAIVAEPGAEALLRFIDAAASADARTG